MKASALLWLANSHGCALHCTVQWLLHSLYYTLYTAQCTLHPSHYTLQTAHCTLHTAHCTLHSEHCRVALLSVCQREDLGSIKYPLFTQRPGHVQCTHIQLYSIHLQCAHIHLYSVHIQCTHIHLYSVHIQCTHIQLYIYTLIHCTHITYTPWSYTMNT